MGTICCFKRENKKNRDSEYADTVTQASEDGSYIRHGRILSKPSSFRSLYLSYPNKYDLDDDLLNQFVNKFDWKDEVS